MDAASISGDMFIQDREDSVHFSRWTKHAVNLDAFVATTVLKVIVLGGGGITLTKDQFEELQTIGQDISKLFRHEIITQDTNGLNN